MDEPHASRDRPTAVGTSHAPSRARGQYPGLELCPPEHDRLRFTPAEAEVSLQFGSKLNADGGVVSGTYADRS